MATGHGASSHMAANTGITSSHSNLTPQQIIIGNGMSMPVYQIGHATLPTKSASLTLNNVLISSSFIKNPIFVRSLTRDNNVSVEFDPFGFSIKDLPTQTVLLRNDSSGDLNLARAVRRLIVENHSFHANHSSALRHARLGRPGQASLQQVLASFDFTSSKSENHTCYACHLSKHVRLPFCHSNNIAFSPF